MIKRNSSFAYYLFKFFFSNRSKIHVLFSPSFHFPERLRFGLCIFYIEILHEVRKYQYIYMHIYLFIVIILITSLKKILMSYNYMSIIKKILRTLNINKLFYEFNLAMHSMILYYFLWSCLLVLARFEGGGVSFVPFLKKLYKQ